MAKVNATEGSPVGDRGAGRGKDIPSEGRPNTDGVLSGGGKNSTVDGRQGLPDGVEGHSIGGRGK